VLTCPKSSDRKESFIYGIPPTRKKYHLCLSAIIFGAGSIVVMNGMTSVGTRRGQRKKQREEWRNAMEILFLGLETEAHASEK